MKQVTYECDRCGITSKDPAIDRWGSYSLTNFPKDVIHLCPSCEQAVEGNKVQRVEMVRRLLRRAIEELYRQVPQQPPADVGGQLQEAA